MPFAYTNICAVTCKTVSSTDATNLRGSTCRAVVPDRLAPSLFRRGERRSEHGRLWWTDFETELLPSRMKPRSLEVDELVEALPWGDPRTIELPHVMHGSI